MTEVTQGRHVPWLREALQAGDTVTASPKQRAAQREFTEAPVLGGLSHADIASKDPDLSIPRNMRPKNRYEVACQQFCPFAGSSACLLSELTAGIEDARKACVTELHL